VQAQILALDVGRRQTLHPERGICRDQAVFGRVVETDDERDQSIVDRLGGQLAGFYLNGQIRYEAADVLHRQLAEGTASQRWHQALATVDLIIAPAAGLQVGLAAPQPPLPVAAEGFRGVADLAALNLLDESAAGVPGGTLARKAPL
jgi:hypothetical protein